MTALGDKVGDKGAEVERLRRLLAEAEQAIVALTCGEVDAMAHAAVSTPLLLERAQEELRGRERLFRAIFEGVEDGIVLVDDDGVFLDANPAACALFGVTKPEIVGRRTEDFSAPGYDAREERQRIIAAGHRRGLLQLQLRDGSTRELEYTASRDILPGLHVSIVRDVTELNRAKNALRASEERYRLLFESSPMPIWLTDLTTLRFIAVNRATLELFGYTEEEFLAMGVADVLPPDELLQVTHDTRNAPDRGTLFASRCPTRKNGTRVELAVISNTFLLDARPVALVIAQDMTERHRLEAQLAQSRKMEAIGILAGGVAHDFNNLLSIIVTYAAFALESLSPSDPLRADLEQVAKAGDRAVSLTRQLLAFSRQQILEPTLMDLNATVLGLEGMLRRLVGASIVLSLATEPRLGTVRADPSQIEQVIMNLVVNARDAMPNGGDLAIETANVAPTDEADTTAHIKRKAQVRLTVIDTGVGIDEKTKQRIFEPFFTTKEQGKGTGLGLATVLGIVEQSGGRIVVHSELGRGTRFDVFLPRVGDSLPAVTTAPSPSGPVGGGETVLVVEDDEQVQTLTRAILRRHGYEVLVASNGGEAFLISEQHAGPIHLLLTDVVLPRMNGRQVAERLLATRPNMKVLYMTGYTDDAGVRQGVLDADVALLQKPVTPDGLPRRVRSVLDAPRSGFLGHKG